MNTLKPASPALEDMGSRKKIVHLIITLETGGCETALLRMLPLLNVEFEHIVFTLQKKGPLAPMFERKGIQVIALEQKGLADIASYVRLIRKLKHIAPNLIVTNLLHADLIGRLLIQFFVPCKVVSSLVTTYNYHRYWLARAFERLSKRLAYGYMTNAESVKRVYVEKFGVSENKISVIPTGLDTNLFSSTEKDHVLRSKLGIDPDDRVIICVASLHENKGHTYLLAAFESLHKVLPNTKLLLVGEGRERKALLRQVQPYLSKHAIHFLGRRSDVPKLLRLSDVFVLPTFFEGMSNAIMEAMACSLPIITTNIPENRELVTHEKTALLCPVGNEKCIFESLMRIFNDTSLAATLGKEARQVVTEKYDLTRTAKAWNDFFSLMSRR